MTAAATQAEVLPAHFAATADALAEVGVRIEAAAPNRSGIAFRLYCEAHEYCREHYFNLAADDCVDITVRLYPLFLAHHSEMVALEAADAAMYAALKA